MTAVTPDFEVSEEEYGLVRDLVYRHCGISLGTEKQALVRARLAKQVRAGGFESIRQYLDHVVAGQGGRAFDKFIDAISTNLTSFFRESQHLDYLRDQVLPELLAAKSRSDDRRLLGWSAACSSGEEPYSLAMTILNAMNEAGPAGRCELRLLATDISTAVLETARRGVYPAARAGTVPMKLRSKYLLPTLDEGTDAVDVSPALRQAVRFRHLNLMDQWPFRGPFDFIFCRNVMIYFDKPTQQKLVERFWHCLAPGGLLFTGHSESLNGIVHQFAHRRPSIYQKSEM